MSHIATSFQLTSKTSLPFNCIHLQIKQCACSAAIPALTPPKLSVYATYKARRVLDRTYDLNVVSLFTESEMQSQIPIIKIGTCLKNIFISKFTTRQQQVEQFKLNRVTVYFLPILLI